MDDTRNTSNQDQQPDLELGNATNTNEGSSQVFQIPESELELTPAASHSHSKTEEQLLIPPQSTPKLTDAFPIKVDQDMTRIINTTAKKPSEMQKSLRVGKLYRVNQNGFQPAPSSHPQPQTDSPVEQDMNEDTDASWMDVFTACCCHSPREWLSIVVGLVCLCTCLYFFLLALQLLGTSFKVVGGCTAGSLLSSDTNPVAALCIGIIATAILQSSSTTTAIIVSLVSGGLDVKQAIYLVMGANVGTSVTSMIVSLAHMGDGAELERAFSGASLLLVFNVSTVVILFPLELITGYLYELSKAMLPASVGQDEKWEGPIKKIVAPFANKIIMANSGLITDLANEDLKCEDKYPVLCFNSTDNRDLYISQQRNPIDFPDFNATNYDFGSPTFVGYDTCDAGLIGCNKKDGKCPVFFQEGASKQDDITAGWVCLIMSLFLLIICLILLVALLKKILLGASTRIIYKATNINGYVSVVIGAAVTVLVQSSSITASSLTPLAGIGVLKVEQMYPLIIGADIGTCITALLASLVSSKVDALQVALCHLFFNITGAIIWYVVPPVRRVPLFFARYLGKVTRKWRQFPIVFIIICFFILPILILGISTCFEKGSRGYQALGIFLTLLIFAVIFYAFIWWRYKGGKSTFRSWIRERKRKEAALKALADDMDYIKVDLEYCKNEIIRLKDFAGVVSANENFHYGPLGQGTDGDEFELPPEETLDGRKSIHGSVSTKNWAGVLADAGVSIKGSLASMKL